MHTLYTPITSVVFAVSCADKQESSTVKGFGSEPIQEELKRYILASKEERAQLDRQTTQALNQQILQHLQIYADASDYTIDIHSVFSEDAKKKLW